MNFAILVFPGSNCDHDVYHVVKHVLGESARFVWHKETSLGDADVVVVPGGFSFGDYLRCGALARHAPIMTEVAAHAARGGPVLGICNGFQILCEAGLLPGALMRNRDRRFICKDVELRVDGAASVFTKGMSEGARLRLPIAHAEGAYFADDTTIDELEGSGRVVLRYVDADGEATESANPNGSVRNVAGIASADGKIVGMMPHPERACEAILGNTDGRAILESVLAHA